MSDNLTPVTGVAGIDVSKLTLDLYALASSRTSGLTKSFPNNGAGHRALHAWLVKKGFVPAGTHVCLEATGPYSEPLAVFLVDAGWRVRVVNPARI